MTILAAALGLGLVALAIGFPVALLCGRSLTWALALTAPATGVGCSVAVAAALLTGTSMVPWLAAIALAGWAAVAVGLFTGRMEVGRGDPGPSVVVAAALAAVIPVLLVKLPSTTWDAFNIWWVNAAGYRAGGKVATDAIDLRTSLLTDAEYPPLVPAVIASVWHVIGAYEHELALRVTELFNAMAVASFGFFTAMVLRLQRHAAWLAAAGVAGLAWMVNPTVGLNGLVDLSWAVLAATAAVLLLAGDTSERSMLAGALFLAAAALTKSEGEAAAIVLVLLTLARPRLRLLRAVPVVIAAVVSVGGWELVVRAIGADTSDRGDYGSVFEIFDFGSAVHDRFVDAASDFAGELAPLALLCATVVVLLVLFARWAGTPLRQPGLVSLLVACVGFVVISVLTFAVRPEELQLLLDVTTYRTILFVRLVLVADVVLAVVATVRVLRGGAEAQPEVRSIDTGTESPSTVTV